MSQRKIGAFVARNFVQVAIGLILIFCFIFNDSMPPILRALASGILALIVWRNLRGDEPDKEGGWSR